MKKSAAADWRVRDDMRDAIKCTCKPTAPDDIVAIVIDNDLFSRYFVIHLNVSGKLNIGKTK